MAMTDLHFLSVADAAKLIRARKLSPVELTEACLQRVETFDPQLNAYITVTAESARREAKRAERDIARGDYRGALHGIPFGLKDIYNTKGVLTSGHSRICVDNVPKEDATTTRKLREAGAVLLGKLATHEFAHGGPSFDLPWPPARNPWHLEHFTGGSSSGSGAAVAAGLAPFALGSDTGGSIRGPAAMCGLVGLKPTYGLVTRRGCLPQCWSLDHVGPMTRGVWDAAIMLQAIAGHDPSDASTSSARPPSFTRDLEAGVRGMRFGLPRRYYVEWSGLHPDVKAAAFAAFAELERQGARIVDVDAPTLDVTQAIWGAMLAEMYEYHRDTLREQPQNYRLATRLLMMASALRSAADLLRAQRLRARLAREIAEILQGVDALIFPGQAEPAGPFPDDPVAKELLRPVSRYTNVWNLVGLPACVVPSGFSQEGLPVSIQIVGKPFDDGTVLRIARAYERATPWHTRRPDPAGWTLPA